MHGIFEHFESNKKCISRTMVIWLVFADGYDHLITYAKYFLYFFSDFLAKVYQEENNYEHVSDWQEKGSMDLICIKLYVTGKETRLTCYIHFLVDSIKIHFRLPVLCTYSKKNIKKAAIKTWKKLKVYKNYLHILRILSSQVCMY